MEDKKIVINDLEKFKALEAVSESEGGKILIDTLKGDIRDDIETIMSLFKGDEMELRCAVAKLKSDLTLLRVLLRSKENVKLTEEELQRLTEIEKS